MKYAILDENGNQIQWVNDLTINEKDLPANAIILTEEQWENRFNNIPVSNEQKKQNLKNQLISNRKFYLDQTFREAMEYMLSGEEYPNQAKREQAKQEIKDIENAKTLTALNKFNINFE